MPHFIRTTVIIIIIIVIIIIIIITIIANKHIYLFTMSNKINKWSSQARVSAHGF